MKLLKSIKKRLIKYKPGKHPDGHLGWILKEARIQEQNERLATILTKVKNNFSLETALMGFDGTVYGERIAEYPFFADWFLKRGKKNP